MMVSHDQPTHVLDLSSPTSHFTDAPCFRRLAMNGLNGLTEKPLLPRVIEFVKASGGAEAGKEQEDVENEPPKPSFYLFSKDRLFSLFQSSGARRLGRGLVNVGNTCFFNSVLQVLTYAIPLQNLLLSKQHSKECPSAREGTLCTLCLLEMHANEIFEAIKAPMKPVKLLKHMPQIASRFRNRGRQEDAHEFLIHLLDSCHQLVSRPSSRDLRARCHKSQLKQAPQQPIPRPARVSGHL